MVRAKFRLTGIKAYDPSQSRELTFQTVYDPGIPEDAAFNKATPSGDIRILVDNPRAFSQFELGASYYVDFERVPP